jgi:MYXO-CTERM domain-containing protein
MKTTLLLTLLMLAPVLAAQSSANLYAGSNNPADGDMLQGAQDHLLLEFELTPTTTSTTDPVIDTMVIRNNNLATAMTSVVDNIKLWRIDFATSQPVLVEINDANSTIALGPTAAYFTGLGTEANTVFRVTGDVKAGAAQGAWLLLRVERSEIFCSSGSISGGSINVSGGIQTVATAVPPVLDTTNLSPTTEGAAYSAQLSATGGNPPYSFSAASLPSGWSLAQNGELTIPASSSLAGNWDLDVTVTDSMALTDTGIIHLLINPPPVITSPRDLPGGRPGENYALQLTAQGGTPLLTWSAVGLPLGWTLDAGGLLEFDFVDALEGEYTFTVILQDSEGVSDQDTFTLKIAEPSSDSKDKDNGGCTTGPGTGAGALLLLAALAAKRRRRAAVRGLAR